MRPAGKGPLDSLYFNYPIFPARHVPELDGTAVRHPVVIVGAGPIGMTAALVLARYGIRSVLIDMRWQSELADIKPSADGVSIGIASPAGNYCLDAEYVLAADGARSPVRSQLGLRMKGDNYEGRYVIADIRMDHDFPTERRAFFEPAGNPGGTVLIHKQPDDIWRVDYQLREGESEADALKEQNIRARVGAILADI